MDVRPALDEDLRSLYCLAFEQQTRWQRVAADVLPRPDLFAVVARHRVTMQYVVERQDEFLGACALFDHDEPSGTVWTEVILHDGVDPEVRTTVATTMLERAFGDWQARVVYTTCHSCEVPVFEGAGFPWRPEGRLKAFHRHGEQLCDAVLLAARSVEPTQPDGGDPWR